MRRLDHPPVFSLQQRRGNHLALGSSEGHAAHVFVLEDDIVRVLLLPGNQLRMPRSWAVAPGLAELPPEGRDRFDLSGFALPAFTVAQPVVGQLLLQTARIRLRIALAGFACQWEALQPDGRWLHLAADRPTQAYNFGWWDQRVYHYLQRERGERYYGLGERAGDANRAGQRYRLCNLDAMGYSARHTDPLYKHIPFYITRLGAAGASYGLFYDTLAECSFDMGRELDNYHGPYRYFVAEHGDLDLYFIAGDAPADITRRYTWLTGRPLFAPRHALGYSGSTMSYTDAPDAQARMDEFLQRCETHDIPCESFHLSSGYNSIGDRRYVFHWNRSKFPDPAAFAARWLAHGVRLCPNIKPALLRDHPLYGEAAQAGLLVHDPDGQPTAVQFWDGTGAYLDFTNPATLAWWQARVTEQLLDLGFAATWNDNNEFEIWSGEARIHGFGQPRAALEARPLQTLLMMQASHAAQRAHAPAERPWLVSRAGMPGMQRYVQTWSGDNATSWETLRYNIRMGLGLAVSGISHSGHDVGGFVGPAPGQELWLRWLQFAIFMPRFSIHSWNDDGSVNEPWMYPECIAQVRELMHLRCRLQTYLYHLLWRYHSAFEPMVRPTWHDFPHDPQCDEECDDMLLGPDLLVAAVVEPGQRERRVWLPGRGAWVDWRTAARHEAGQWLSVPAPLEGPPPLLAREGCAIPLNTAPTGFGRTEDERGFRVFPLAGAGRFAAECFEDDGHSTDALHGRHGHWRLEVESDAHEVCLRLTACGTRPPQQARMKLWLPAGEARALVLATGALLDTVDEDAHWRCLEVDLSAPAQEGRRPPSA